MSSSGLVSCSLKSSKESSEDGGVVSGEDGGDSESRSGEGADGSAARGGVCGMSSEGDSSGLVGGAGCEEEESSALIAVEVIAMEDTLGVCLCFTVCRGAVEVAAVREGTRGEVE